MLVINYSERIIMNSENVSGYIEPFCSSKRRWLSIQLFPLYPEEMKFKLEHGYIKRIELFQVESFAVNIHRNNYCKE